MEHGCFNFIIKPKMIVSVSEMYSEESDQSYSNFALQYSPKKLSLVSKRLNSEQITNFVQKLGFLECKTDGDQKQVELFQQLCQVPTI